MTQHHDLCIYTIGHSTLSEKAFIPRLQSCEIETLVDIRSLPGSRRWPQFDRESLERSLPQSGIAYVWLPALGGRRTRGLGKDSPNTAWEHVSFRNYADYMMTSAFRQGIDELMAFGSRARTAMMCAEALYWRCHRRLVGDYLVAHGVRVEHIMAAGPPRPHTLAPEARLQADGTVLYPGGAAGLFAASGD